MPILKDDFTDRDEVLRHYAEVETPKAYLQIDGFINPEGSIDSMVNPDGERLSLMAGYAKELWRGDYGLRVHISPTTNTEDAITLLKQAITWLEGDLGGVQQIAALTLGQQEPPPEF